MSDTLETPETAVTRLTQGPMTSDSHSVGTGEHGNGCGDFRLCQVLYRLNGGILLGRESIGIEVMGRSLKVGGTDADVQDCSGRECLLAPSRVGRGLGRAVDNEVGKRSKISYSVTPTLVPDACHGCRCISHPRLQL